MRPLLSTVLLFTLIAQSLVFGEERSVQEKLFSDLNTRYQSWPIEEESHRGQFLRLDTDILINKAHIEAVENLGDSVEIRMITGIAYRISSDTKIFDNGQLFSNVSMILEEGRRNVRTTTEQDRKLLDAALREFHQSEPGDRLGQIHLGVTRAIYSEALGWSTILGLCRLEVIRANSDR